MFDVDILVASYRTPELLAICIPYLLKSLTTNSRIIVVLNEADQSSIDLLDKYNVAHIDRADNIGPSAVDFAIPLLNSKYVTNINTDMIFAPGWDRISIDTIEEYYPATASCAYVENDGPVYKDNLGPFTIATAEKFLENVKNKKYDKYKKIYMNCHPITCKTEDFLKVGGYSDNFDKDWILALGRGLEDHFSWRLKQLNPEYKSILNPKAIVFHGVSLTAKKKPVAEGIGKEFFKKKTTISIEEFIKSIHYLEEVV